MDKIEFALIYLNKMLEVQGPSEGFRLYQIRSLIQATIAYLED